MFEVIGKNKFKSGIIVTMVSVFLAVVIYFIAYFSGIGHYALPLAIGMTIITSLISYFTCDKIVLSINGARPADGVRDKQIVSILEGLCISSGMPMPKLYIMDEASPNAFATGRNPKNSVICVTTGLINNMEYYELEGVLAHELAHIKNYDILLATVVTVFIGMIVILSNIWTRSLFWSGTGRGRRSSRSRDNNGKGGAELILFLVGLIFIILAPIAGKLMQFALSRNREYLADATSVEFTRNPGGLISALRKLDSSVQKVERANDATAAMYIVNPLKNIDGKKAKKIFSTHPLIPDRIKALQNIH